MLYHVKMDVHPPLHMPQSDFDKLKIAERDMAQDLQRRGVWLHLWRIVGQYSNVSIFDVGSHDELHTLLSGLPLFPFMTVAVTPLARHPSAV